MYACCLFNAEIQISSKDAKDCEPSLGLYFHFFEKNLTSLSVESNIFDEGYHFTFVWLCLSIFNAVAYFINHYTRENAEVMHGAKSLV